MSTFNHPYSVCCVWFTFLYGMVFCSFVFSMEVFFKPKSNKKGDREADSTMLISLYDMF